MSKYKVSIYSRETADLLQIRYVEATSDADAKRITLDYFHALPDIVLRNIYPRDPRSTDPVYVDEAAGVYRNFQSFRWTGTMGFDGEFEKHLILHRSYPVYAFPVKVADGTTMHF